MTDIRKDFEAWCSFNCIIPSPARFEAYQAGRAHGVDELIEKLDGYFKDDKCEKISAAFALTVFDIIRKHFGKE